MGKQTENKFRASHSVETTQLTYMNQDTFFCNWDGVAFGALSSVPFVNSTFRSPEEFRQWLITNAVFVHSVGERMERMVKLLAQHPRYGGARSCGSLRRLLG